MRERFICYLLVGWKRWSRQRWCVWQGSSKSYTACFFFFFQSVQTVQTSRWNRCMGKTANWSHDRLRVNTPVLRLEVRANPGDFFCPIDRHMRINSERVSPAIGPVLTKLISLPIAKSIQKYELVKTVNPVANKVECADFRQQLSVAELSKSLAWS